MKSVLVILSLCLAPSLARAHEVLHSVERGRAIAVKAFFADGEALAYTEYQIFSPLDGRIPYQKGRTDRAGYLAFVPDAPGKWRVKVTDSTGHGLDLEIDGTAGASTTNSALATWAFVVRPLFGVSLVVAIFTALVVFYRRKGRRG